MTFTLPTRNDIHSAYEKGEEAVVEIVDELLRVINELNRANVLLAQRVKALEDQTAKNSRNSSKPPATDGYRKPTPRNLRTVSGRKPGGQKGHPGSTLQQVANPDEWIQHPLLFCQNCNTSLADEPVQAVEKRQVFDLPEISIIVTEHQAEKKHCPNCGKTTTAAFPRDITQPAQYGPRIRAQGVYFSQEQLIPLNRTAEILSDLYGAALSETTILSFQEEASVKLLPVTGRIKDALTYHSPVDHFDETGIRVANKLYWLHSVSNKLLTLYRIHKKRGVAAIEAVDILPHFLGKAIHDHWESYFSYTNCRHALCNAHHLRELKFIAEQYNQPWAKQMAKLLVTIKDAVHAAKQAGMDALRPTQLKTFSDQYDQLVHVGLSANPMPPPEKQQHRGRVKHTPAQNLLLRLQKNKQETLLFMYDFAVPFDNNQAERDIRMTKLKQKISGCFRTEKYATIFCAIRGYISTVRKHNHRILAALESLFQGDPYIPETLLLVKDSYG